MIEVKYFEIDLLETQQKRKTLFPESLTEMISGSFIEDGDMDEVFNGYTDVYVCIPNNTIKKGIISELKYVQK